MFPWSDFADDVGGFAVAFEVGDDGVDVVGGHDQHHADPHVEDPLHLAFGQIMYVLVLKLRHITGGEDGVGGFPLPPLNIPGLGSIDIADSTNFFYFSIVILGLCIYFLWFFLKTPMGSVVISLRDREHNNLPMLTQLERARTDQITNVLDKDHVQLIKRQFIESAMDLCGRQMARAIGVDLNGRRVGRPNALGIDIRLNVPFDDSHLDLGTQLGTRTRQERRLARTGR